MNKLKTGLTYLIILLGGLASGYALTKVPDYFKKPYSEGDFSAYYAGKPAPVLLYGTAWCQFCAQTRAHFKAKGIAFVDLDIEKSPAARAEHEKLGGGGVPVVLVGERRIQGYNPAVLDEALALAKP
jgi:glutaredoxin